MTWDSKIKSENLSWLLEEENPGVRYLALRDILKLPAEDSVLIAAREKPIKKNPLQLSWKPCTRMVIG